MLRQAQDLAESNHRLEDFRAAYNSFRTENSVYDSMNMALASVGLSEQFNGQDQAVPV